MPRSAGQSIPKYRKHRATGQAICTIGGRDHYLGPHGTTASKLEYDRIIGEWLANNRQPFVQADSITVSELILQFWEDARKLYVKDGRPTGEQSALQSALRPVRELYGQHLAVDFGPLALEAVRNRMITKGWARGNINRSIDRVRRLFRWGVRKQLIPPSVVQGLEAVPGLRRGQSDARESVPVSPVDDSTVEATLTHLPDVPADMVRLQRITGMRPAEVCILRSCDLDRSADVWTYKPSSHKTEHHGRARVIFLGPQAQGVLLRYLARDSQAYCFRPCDSEAKRLVEQEANRKTARSCGNIRGSNVKKKPKMKPGEKYDVNSYRRAIHRACDKAKVERWSPNRLRHSAATEIRKRFGLEAAQVTLGHASADITQVYAERDNTLAIEVAAKIG